MVAIDGKTYAQVLYGNLHLIFTILDLPQWNENDIQVVDITDIDPRPQLGWVFDGVKFVCPIIPQFNLASAQAQKIEEINQAYNRANTSTFKYLDVVYNADSVAQNNINSTANYINQFNAFPEGWLGVWLADDGTMLSMPTPADFWPFYQAYCAQGVYNITHFNQLKAQVMALPNTATQADLDAIVW